MALAFGFDLAASIFQGETGGLELRFVLTGRGGVRRIILARAADNKEQRQWHASR
jgi:hypothetical protein